MSALLEVKNLKKYFKTARGTLHAVDDVSFTVDKGCTLGIVGESGCGKSTMGRAIVQLHDPTAGQILFDGRDVTHLKKKEFKAYNRDVQMIFQDPFSSLNPRMSVFDAIAEPLRNNPDKLTDLDRQVFSLMDTVGLAQRLADAYPHELDGGRRQRIGIARALALEPQFIVCDEPVSALDVSIQAQIINLLRSLQKQFGLTYLFISHDLSVVEYISDTVGVMYLGNMVEFAPTDKLYANPKHPYTEALFSAIPVPDPDYKMNRIILEGSIPSPANPPKGCKFHTRCRKCMEICKYVQPDFVELEPEHFCACHLYNSPERSKELEAVMQDAIREIEASKNGEKSKKGK